MFVAAQAPWMTALDFQDRFGDGEHDMYMWSGLVLTAMWNISLLIPQRLVPIAPLEEGWHVSIL